MSTSQLPWSRRERGTDTTEFPVSGLGQVKAVLNRLLSPLNVRIESRTAELAEFTKLQQLVDHGHFTNPVFPILEQFQRCDPSRIFDEIAKSEARFAEFASNRPDDGSFSLVNDYYTTPDAEVLYTMVAMFRPARIIEVGSGNSTKLFRHAIIDRELTTRLISIDPDPRCEIAKFSDQVIRQRLEEIKDPTLFSSLEPNDVLFIDSSHEIKVGNDVVRLLLNVLPVLRSGVLIHLHDIFLPWDYPQRWIVDYRWNWTEQYLVQALLAENQKYEVLWPAYYLQRTMPKFEARFKQWRSVDASSLWLRRA